MTIFVYARRPLAAVLLVVVFVIAIGLRLQAQGGRGRGAAPTPAPAGRPPAPPPATVGPTLAEATKALDAAVAALVKIGVNETCVVVDSRGDLVALHRMDRARFYLNDIARGKALASAMFGLPGDKFAAMANTPWFQNLNTAAQGRPGGGGVPIIRNNEMYAAIGCSGGTGGEDDMAAKAAAATFQ